MEWWEWEWWWSKKPWSKKGSARGGDRAQEIVLERCGVVTCDKKECEFITITHYYRVLHIDFQCHQSSRDESLVESSHLSLLKLRVVVMCCVCTLLVMNVMYTGAHT